MSYFLRIRKFVKTNERFIPPVAIFGGFILDSITLQRIDLPLENIILGTYLTAAAVLIFLISLVDIKDVKHKFLIKIRPFMGIALLFVFGGIFSGFTIFYVRSANLFSSWPFILMLVGIMVGTEYFKKYFTRMTIQIVIFYFALFSYLIFLVPVISKKMGPWIFVLSGILSLFFVFLYIRIFQKVIADKFEHTKINIWRGVIGVFALVNILYFTNVIPPIPLSLKDAGIYHHVKRDGLNYAVLDEERSFFDKVTLYEKVRITRGESLYLFSSVFAPTKLDTDIVHEWQYRDEKGRWITSSKIPFRISGGRDGGYRGYSVKAGLTEGRWRVNVKTTNGQIVGRKGFRIYLVEGGQTLISKIK